MPVAQPVHVEEEIALHCPAVQFVQNSAFSALHFPAGHTGQKGIPASGWNVPAVHSAQFAAFVVTDVVPASHFVQLRSDLAVGCVDTFSPGPHSASG